MNESISVAEAYARGHVTFMGLELAVAPGALVPRAETELLARAAIDVLRPLPAAEPHVIDMCCGAGNLACAIACALPRARVWASDLTEDCVSVARRNVDLHQLGGRVHIHQGDLFSAFSGQRLKGQVDVIVCNPPYISEPREAFAAGPYGISIHQRVIRESPEFLKPGGVLLFEVGLGQERQVKALFERSRAFEAIRSVANESGEGRVVLGQLKASQAL
jgi:release factor glutamine methyltransferase